MRPHRQAPVLWLSPTSGSLWEPQGNAFPLVIKLPLDFMNGGGSGSRDCRETTSSALWAKHSTRAPRGQHAGTQGMAASLPHQHLPHPPPPQSTRELPESCLIQCFPRAKRRDIPHNPQFGDKCPRSHGSSSAHRTRAACRGKLQRKSPRPRGQSCRPGRTRVLSGSCRVNGASQGAAGI